MATVIVIGASSGIGLAAARQLAQRHDRLVLASRSAARLADAEARCRADGATDVLTVVTDVRDEASVDALFATARERFGIIDAVIHTATVMAYGDVDQVPSEIFTTVVDTAVHGTFYVARAALKAFTSRQTGTLVVVNSLVGSIAAPSMGSYVAAKWAQAGLLRTLQIENRRRRDIHICVVSPGGVNTPIYSQAANVTGRAARPPIPIDSPEKVARAAVHCLDRPRARVSVGIANPLVVFGFRFLPYVYDQLVTPLLHFASLSNPGSTQPSNGSVLSPDDAGEGEHGPWAQKWNPLQGGKTPT